MPPSAKAGLTLATSAFCVLASYFAVALAPEAAAPRLAYPDAPLPGHTGGFGEPTCLACHFDGQPNPPGGSLSVGGWPDRVAADSTYELVVRVEHRDLVLAGFQASVRTRDGGQAGSLASADDRSTTVTAPSGIQYILHTFAGTVPTGDRVAAWRVHWKAPTEAGEVWLHLSANAANGDRSEFGDHIYADSLRARVEQGY